MLDELWQQLKSEAEAVTKEEPLLASYVYACVLNHESLQSALSFICLLYTSPSPRDRG